MNPNLEFNIVHIIIWYSVIFVFIDQLQLIIYIQRFIIVNYFNNMTYFIIDRLFCFWEAVYYITYNRSLCLL